MIDGAEHFHYLGVATRQSSALLVFQEGVLIFDMACEGWGIMSASALDRLISPESSPRSGSEQSSSEDDIMDSLADSEHSTYSTPITPITSRPGSTSNSALSSPRLPGIPATPANGPAAGHSSHGPIASALLGWHPCEAVVFAGPVTLAAITTYKSLNDNRGELQAFVAQLKAGRWAPLPDASPMDATMVVVQMFGYLQVITWDGIWRAAGNTGHQPRAMSAQRACQLVANSVVAEVCTLAIVPHAERSDYLGHLQAAGISVMLFDQGLLVLTHPDPDLIGWHDLNDTSRCGFMTPDDARLIDRLCSENRPVTDYVFQAFFLGMMDVHVTQGPFVAAIYSHKLRRWLYLQLDRPQVLKPNDPAGSTLATVQQMLRHARRAPVHDLQTPYRPDGLTNSNWRVPVFVGAIQCIAASVDVPGLLATRWHDTLQPVIEQRLLAHRSQESAWLASGVITQPIDRLIDLMRRDLGLRRPEVWVMWPGELLEDLFKALAPEKKTHVVIAPKVADVDLALQKYPCTLLVFQTSKSPQQSVVLVQGTTCWSVRERMSLVAVKARVVHALAPGATERLVALACVAV